ncbi:MAG: hypothetical protein ABIQ16_09890 [Polyangiaceae bacterium]
MPICLLGLGSANAQASTTFPPKVQEAMMKRLNAPYCVPQCIVCHKTNDGGFNTLNAFGKNLETNAGLSPGQPNTVVPAFDKWFADQPNADSDMDGTSDLIELERGDSPAVAGVRGVSMICPDIRYGCGARIAPAPPPVDRVGLFSAGLVVLGITLLRRQRQAKNAR